MTKLSSGLEIAMVTAALKSVATDGRLSAFRLEQRLEGRDGGTSYQVLAVALQAALDAAYRLGFALLPVASGEPAPDPVAAPEPVAAPAGMTEPQLELLLTVAMLARSQMEAVREEKARPDPLTDMLSAFGSPLSTQAQEDRRKTLERCDRSIAHLNKLLDACSPGIVAKVGEALAAEQAK